MNRRSINLFAAIGLISSFHIHADSIGPVGEAHPFVQEAGDYVYVRLVGFPQGQKDDYLAKHKKFYKENCGNTQGQAKSIIDKCTGIDIARRYPQSGMYHKDDPSKPLWTDSKCYQGSYMLPDGEHQVLIGPWASSVEQLAVQFCRHGEIIADYPIKDLVDDQSKLIRSVSHVFWRSKTIFDDKASTLFIKTVDDNEFTFDIRSGRIINYRYDAPPVYQADVVFKNGERKSLHNLRACSALTMVSVLQGNGLPNHVINLIEPVENTSVKDGEVIQTISIPFELVKNLKFVKQVKKDRLVWEISMHDGNSGQFMVDTTFAGFCGTDTSGKEIELSPKQITELGLSLVKTAKSTTGHRSVALRMRWDKKNWEIARNLACEKIDVTTFTTLQDAQSVIANFQRNECTADSRNYVNALDKVGDWIQKQANDSQVKDFALEVAKMQNQANLYYQAYTLNEYILKSYDQTVEKGNLNILYAKQRLLMEMMRVSSKAGAIATAQKWVGVFEAINGEIRRQNKEKRQHKENKEIKEFLNYIENITLESVEPTHSYMGKGIKHLIYNHCELPGEASAMAVVVYQRLGELEMRLHPEGHVHFLEAWTSLSRCYKHRKDYREAQKTYQKAFEVYSHMDKNGALSDRENLQFIERFLNLAGTFLLDKDQLTEAQIMLYSRQLSIVMDLNKMKHAIATLSRLARTYEISGNLLEAEKYYKQRVKLSKALTDEKHPLKESSKKDLDRFYKKLEQKKQRKESEQKKLERKKFNVTVQSL